jgi:hypothetical protein
MVIDSTGPGQRHRFGKRVHTPTWTTPPGSPAIGNSTFIIGDREVIVVDTGFLPSAGKAILDAQPHESRASPAADRTPRTPIRREAAK